MHLSRNCFWLSWTGSSVNDTNYMEKNGTQTAYPHINETGGYSYYWRNRHIDSRRWNVFQHGFGEIWYKES